MKTRRSTRFVLAFLAIVSAPGGALGQTSSDSAAIVTTALDYIEGWYEGDAVRMARALHPELAKRLHVRVPGWQESFIQETGATGLVASTALGGGTDTPRDRRRNDVVVLDQFRGAASVKVEATEWVDYLHLVRTEGGWKVLNVLWELRESPTRP